MRKAIIITATLVVDNIIAIEADAIYDPGPGRFMVDDDGTAERGGMWADPVFVPKPPPDPAIEDAIKTLEASRLIARAVDTTFLDGFWLLFKVSPPVGVAAIDDAVAADDKPAFVQFFKDQVKLRL